MYTFILVIAIISSSTSDPRNPKIYNVLISTKKNLAPSQALPVYEPVLRTTSLGYAFSSPFVYSHFGTLPAATTYIQQPGIIHNIQTSSPVYQTQQSIPENRYPQQEPVSTLPEVRHSNHLPSNPYIQQPGININDVRQPNSPVYQTQPSTSENGYSQQRPLPTLQEEEPPNQILPVDQQRPNLYMQQPGSNVNEVQQPNRQVYQTQQSISENRYPQREPALRLPEIRPPNQPQANQQRSYTETRAGVKSLPNNVIPLEQYVPYYAPLTYQQYLPRIEPVHLQPQLVSYEASAPGPQPANYERPEPIPPEPTTYERHPPIPPQPLTYEKLFNDNQPSDPKQIIANFKRNPGIADVPPPPLPVKTS